MNVSLDVAQYNSEIEILFCRHNKPSLVFTVQECKRPASRQSTEDGTPTAATWPWFALMDEALGQSAAVSQTRAKHHRKGKRKRGGRQRKAEAGTSQRLNRGQRQVPVRG